MTLPEVLFPAVGFQVCGGGNLLGRWSFSECLSSRPGRSCRVVADGFPETLSPSVPGAGEVSSAEVAERPEPASGRLRQTLPETRGERDTTVGKAGRSAECGRRVPLGRKNAAVARKVSRAHGRPTHGCTRRPGAPGVITLTAAAGEP